MDYYRTTTRDYSHYSYGPLLRTATMDHYTDHYYRPPQETAYCDNDSDYDY